MRRLVTAIVLVLTVTFGSGDVFANTATLDIASEDVEAAGGTLTISTALPANAVGKRLSRATLEVPIVLRESENVLYNEFPLLELYEEGSELSKQTIVLEQGHSGVLRIDVTRFVRAWSNSEARAFILGAVSENNETAFELGSVGGWPGRTKARLTIEYMDRDGASVASDVE